MRLAYPAVLRELPDTVLVSFPDVPEALTEGETVEDALHEAADCLPIPVPSERPNAPLVRLPALVAAKVALYQTMLGQPEDKAGLAERIGLSESALGRLVDLVCRSPIGQVEDALHALGLALCVEVSAT